MAIIREDYVSFEVAKLLKEKGFDWACIGYYVDDEPDDVKYSSICETNSIWEARCCSAPTIQMAMKWLEIEKYIAIIPVLSSIFDSEKFFWNVEIIIAKTGEKYSQGWVYEDRGRICEAAIKYCLENLI